MKSDPGGEPSSARILVIEDELPMRTALEDCLQADGYRVLTAENGERGLERAIAEKPDAVLLDVMMPRLDGFAVCRELRHLQPTTPILMLTAKGQIEDRVHGLDSGADDYLVKPFSTEELLARVRALLRRTQRETRIVTKLELGSVRLDFLQHLAWKGKTPVHFTVKEWAMLKLMAECEGEAISRERFLDIVWGYTAFPTTRTVDNHIASIRGKIESNPNEPAWIKTVHGVGYRLETLKFAKS